jgi:hypothetical protein
MVKALLHEGPLGLMVLLLAAACVKLWGENKSLQLKIDGIQQARLDDAKSHTVDAIQNHTQCVNALTTTATSMEAQTEVMKELKETIAGFGEDLRRTRRV